MYCLFLPAFSEMLNTKGGRIDRLLFLEETSKYYFLDGGGGGGVLGETV